MNTQVTVIIGKRMSGKTTLLNKLLRMRGETTGELEVYDECGEKTRELRLTRAVPTDIFIVAQNYCDLPWHVRHHVKEAYFFYDPCEARVERLKDELYPWMEGDNFDALMAQCKDIPYAVVKCGVEDASVMVFTD